MGNGALVLCGGGKCCYSVEDGGQTLGSVEGEGGTGDLWRERDSLVICGGRGTHWCSVEGEGLTGDL